MSAPPVAVVAALRRELASLVAGLKPVEALRHRGIHLYRGSEAIFVAAGMGAGRVTLAVEAALQSEPALQSFVSVGLAGACHAGLIPGRVAEASQVIDVLTGERFATDVLVDRTILASGGTIASIGEKRRLYQAYGAALVDMEAATVARLARAHGLRFRAIKGVSDAHDFELASLGRFTGKHGAFRTGAFALHTALRPALWRPAMVLGRGSKQALAALALRVRETLLETPVSNKAS